MARKPLTDAEFAKLRRSLAFMLKKLDESRKSMRDMPIVVPGADGIAKNPAFDAYIRLNREACATARAIDELAGAQQAAAPRRSGEPQASPLLLMRGSAKARRRQEG